MDGQLLRAFKEDPLNLWGWSITFGLQFGGALGFGLGAFTGLFYPIEFWIFTIPIGGFCGAVCGAAVGLAIGLTWPFYILVSPFVIQGYLGDE